MNLMTIIVGLSHKSLFEGLPSECGGETIIVEHGEVYEGH